MNFALSIKWISNPFHKLVQCFIWPQFVHTFLKDQFNIFIWKFLEAKTSTIQGIL